MSIANSRAWAAAPKSGVRRRATRATLPALALLLPFAGAGAADAPVELARDGRTAYVVALPAGASPAESLAAAELAGYLARITGAAFPIVRGEAPARALVVAVGGGELGLELSGEAYAIAVRGARVHLAGGSPRAVLYAAYDFLGRLGCQWLAPEFAFYDGRAEVVPRRPTLTYEPAGDVVERPAFASRILDAAQASSQDTATLRRMVAWMPKLRYNTLRLPLNHGGNGRVVWDHWRAAIAPELERRDLTIEVGGHGYQNFLSAAMEEGTLFARHPEWFGRDTACRRSPAEHLVFDTENADAVGYLVRNVSAYLAAHPEVDVFDFWPPDGGRWSECGEWAARGTPGERQARLVVALHEELRRAHPDVRLEMIAYADALEPPTSVVLPPDVIVEFCPIDQSFDAPIGDPSVPGNRRYAESLRRWRAAFPGHIGAYTYYRKYAWRSLPNVIPHYIQRDVQWYAAVPLQGIAMYGEPADWFTYELNLLALGELAWNPNADVDALVERYVEARFGAGRDAARAAYATLEDVFRLRGSIPFSAPDSAAQLVRARREIEARLLAVREARASRDAAGDAADAANLGRLALMLDFAGRDLALQEARVRGAGPADVRARVEELVAFLHRHGAEGVFLARDGDVARYVKHYTRESRIDAPPAPGT